MAPMSCDEAHSSEAKVKPAQQMMNRRFPVAVGHPADRRRHDR